MQTRTYQFYTTASQAAAAQITIVAPGYIHGVCWTAFIPVTTDDLFIHAELSFQSASQLTTHNALGVIDSMAVYNNFLTSGGIRGDLNKVCMGMYIPVGIGQILYLNCLNSAVGVIKANVHVIER